MLDALLHMLPKVVLAVRYSVNSASGSEPVVKKGISAALVTLVSKTRATTALRYVKNVGIKWMQF